MSSFSRLEACVGMEEMLLQSATDFSCLEAQSTVLGRVEVMLWSYVGLRDQPQAVRP
jgi:hypothetical protein